MITREDYKLFLAIIASISAPLVYIMNIMLAGCRSSRQDYYKALIFVYVFSLITYLLTKRERYKIQAVCGVAIGITAYTLYIYWNTRHFLCVVFSAVAAVIIVVCMILYLVSNNRRKSSFVHYLFSRSIDSLYLSRILVAAIGVIACIVIPLSYRIIITQIYSINGKAGNRNQVISAEVLEAIIEDSKTKTHKNVYEDKDYYIKPIYGEEYRLSKNFERIKPLVLEEWNERDILEKQDSVVAAIECQARYWGIPFKLDIKFSDSLDSSTKGYYSHTKHMICINNKMLRDEEGVDALNTAIHEVRHAYQHAMCDAYTKLSPEERNLICFYGVDKWCENINKYADGNENYEAYVSQVLERDARLSADKEISEYRAIIEEMLAEGEESEEGENGEQVERIEE